jgi:formylglycine-generating enzyme required for sulfatase activity
VKEVKLKDAGRKPEATSKPVPVAANLEGTKALPLPKETTIPVSEKVSIKLALIASGKFMMGSPDGEKGRSADEGPQREVTITKPFYMGATEVTQAQYEAVMGKNPSSFKGPQNPVDSVSWEDAVDFCKKLSEKTGKKVRLPTEAEWEYACRAGTKTRFSFGDDDTGLCDYAWYTANSESKTHSVGEKKPNAWGLYDMHGNVWEWCSDYGAHSYANAKNVDPQGPASGSTRVLRGGRWRSTPRFCWSAFRFRYDPGVRSSYYGFRVVLDL